MRGKGQLYWHERLERDYPNVRATLAWCFSPTGDALIGCQLVGALFSFWYVATRHLLEAVRWIIAAQQVVSDTMPPAVQAKVWLAVECFTSRDLAVTEKRCRRMHELFMIAGDRANAAIAWGLIGRALFYRGDDPPGVLRHQEEAVAQSRAAGDVWGLRYNLMLQGEFLRYIRRDYHQSEVAYKEALAVARSAGNLSEVARTTERHICGIAQERLQFDEALRYAEEALAGARQIADPLMESEGLFKIAENLYYLGDIARAEEQLEECLTVTRERLDEYHLIPPVLLMAKVQNALGDRQRSMALYAEALRVGQSQRHLFNIYTVIDGLAAVAATRGYYEEAALLRGVADHFIELNRHYRKPYNEREYAPAIASTVAALGTEAYQIAYATGRAMTPDEGINAARALISADHETIPAVAIP